MSYDFIKNIPKLVKLAFSRAKLGNSAGFGELPVEVLNNECAINILFRLFLVCFDIVTCTPHESF